MADGVRPAFHEGVESIDLPVFPEMSAPDWMSAVMEDAVGQQQQQQQLGELDYRAWTRRRATTGRWSEATRARRLRWT